MDIMEELSSGHQAPQNEMLIPLLLFVLFQHLQGAPLVDTESSAATSFSSTNISSIISRSHIEFGMRTKADIIITCLATILACTWTAIHPNIPAPNDSQFDIFKRRIRMTFYALLAPEAITAFALRQRLAASEIANEYNSKIVEPALQKFNSTAAQNVTDPSSEQAASEHQGNNAPAERSLITALRQGTVTAIIWLPQNFRDWFTRPALPEKRKGRRERWTLAHRFFLQMGGFMISSDGMPLKTVYRLERITDFIGAQKIAALTMTEAEINDRSKGDVISKTVVILQTTWFLAQCIARWATSLAVTELEVITLGFVILNGLTYACWWHKPQNVSVPVYLDWVSTSEAPPAPPNNLTKTSYIRIQFQDLIGSDGSISFAVNLLNLLIAPFAPVASLLTEELPGNSVSLRVSMFYSEDSEGSTGNTVSLTMSAVAVMFGVVHLAPAWFLIFPSHTAMVIWRTCAIVTTVVPITVVALISATQSKTNFMNIIIAILLLIFAISYITSRIALFVLVFISLHHLFPQALTTIEWLSVFPHI